MTDDPNSIATTFTRVLFATTDAEVVDPASVLAALAAAGWEVNPAGTADRLAADLAHMTAKAANARFDADALAARLAALLDAIGDPAQLRAIARFGLPRRSHTDSHAYLRRIAAAVQPPDPNQENQQGECND
jgi:hypothetical protein